MADTFNIIPVYPRSLWLLVAMVGTVFVILAFLLVQTARGAYRSRFEVSSEGLRLRGDVYGRLVPASAIRGDAIRIVDVNRTSELAPRVRTFGTSVSGYQAGWFRLGNGEKALLYLTDRSQAVYVPTTAGYSLLLSPQEPQRLVDRLRDIALPKKGG
jgi:hypothetical protein